MIVGPDDRDSRSSVNRDDISRSSGPCASMGNNQLNQALADHHERRNLPLRAIGRQIVVHLKIQPEFGGCIERLGK